MAKTTMIVDDSIPLRQVARIALRGAGFEVTEDCDGLDALGQLDGSSFARACRLIAP